VSHVNEHKCSLRNANQKRDHERLLRNARTARYRRHDKAGLKVIPFLADPSDIRDLCVEAGVAVLSLDPKSLGQSLMVLIDHWNAGRITVVRTEQPYTRIPVWTSPSGKILEADDGDN
jgi:hypothetical protein